MNTLSCFVLLALVYAAAAVPLFDEHFKYSRYYNYTDETGALNVLDLEAEPDMSLINEVTRNPDDTTYHLYTRRNPNTAQVLTMNDAGSITSSNFDPSKQTIVIAHGWMSGRTTEPNPTLRSVYLAKDDVNIISLDWRRLAMAMYSTAVRGVPEVGRGLGRFLRFLNGVTGAPYSKMHLTGFSLGAHLVGNAGRELGGQVARITGLDPAGPLWSFNNEKLSAADAVYVEAIHTDGGYTIGGLGIGKAVAAVDFFPNGGVSQPGCSHNICNHNRSWELFAATVTYNHLEGRQCTSTSQISSDRCRGKSMKMGNKDLNKRGSGMYRLRTRRRYPF